ncbi:MAG TPA: TlpA disulfide reductase family protein [Jiangellaceae bacterium]|nr:TlpA disulfide reductase family protein [Jiangellaceae bacterium]
MSLVRLAATLVVAVLAAGACSDGQVQRADDTARTGYIEGSGAVTAMAPDERKPAPEFGGPLLGDENSEFDLADTVGDVVVLNVWGSWCPPCRQEAPALQAVHEELVAEGVQFVGVNVRDNTTDALAFEEQFGVTYPSVVDSDGRRLLAFRDTMPPNAIPTTLVIDREGRLAVRVLGAITETSLRDLITDVLAEDPA